MISVVLATHNGASTLPLTLEAMKHVDIPEGGIEIIAVDNASTDETRALLEECRGTLPLTVLSEPRKGKCFALNKAIEIVKGELVVFTDDDVIPDRHWLTAFQDAAARHQESSLFAGQVRHHWLAEPPRWLRRLADEGRSYGGTRVDRPEGPVKPGFFKGANFMVRREVLDGIRFSEEPGVNFGGHEQAGGGEDTAFIKQAVAQGYKTRFVSRPCVKHIVRPHEIGLAPIFRRYVRIGRAMVMNSTTPVNLDAATVFGYPRYVFRTIPLDALKALRLWLSGNTDAAVGELLEIAKIWGKAAQSREFRLKSRKN